MRVDHFRYPQENLFAFLNVEDIKRRLDRINANLYRKTSLADGYVLTSHRKKHLDRFYVPCVQRGKTIFANRLFVVLTFRAFRGRG
jgi:hypothetical protein